MGTSNNSGGKGSGKGRGPVKPTDVTYRELFGRRLPPCMITLRTFGKARGYFSPDRFVHLTDVTTTHEIALDPRQFMDRTAVEVLSTLAHEMCHLEQREYGTPSRNGYHNREWVDLMARIGLVASDTGRPGGKQTGQAMTHYIEPGGRFETVARRLVDAGRFTLGWADIEGFIIDQPDGAKPGAKTVVPAPKAAKSGRAGVRAKYVCGTCTAAVWGKSGLTIGCCLGTTDTGHEPAAMIE